MLKINNYLLLAITCSCGSMRRVKAGEKTWTQIFVIMKVQGVRINVCSSVTRYR